MLNLAVARNQERVEGTLLESKSRPVEEELLQLLAAVDGDEWRAKMEIPPDHSAEDQTAQGGDGEGAGFAGGGQVNMHATKMWISLRCELSRSSSKGREGYKPHLQGLSS